MNNRSARCLLSLALLLGGGAVLAEDRMVVHVASSHSSGSSDYNERNRGLGLRLGAIGHEWVIGAFDNSFNETSVYGMYSQPLHRSMRLQISVELGLIGGYDDKFRTRIDALGATAFGTLTVVARLDLVPDPTFSFAPTEDGGVVLFSVSEAF